VLQSAIVVQSFQRWTGVLTSLAVQVSDAILDACLKEDPDSKVSSSCLPDFLLSLRSQVLTICYRAESTLELLRSERDARLQQPPPSRHASDACLASRCLFKVYSSVLGDLDEYAGLTCSQGSRSPHCLQGSASAVAVPPRLASASAVAVRPRLQPVDALACLQPAPQVPMACLQHWAQLIALRVGRVRDCH
jgi:hypothetical protein